MPQIEFKEFKLSEKKFSSGQHSVYIGLYKDRLFTLKQEKSFDSAVSEAIKYELARKLDLIVPEQHIVIDEENNKFYIATEIVPGFIPMGILSTNSLFSLPISKSSSWLNSYKEWMSAHGLPQDPKVINPYQQLISEYEKQREEKKDIESEIEIMGLENLFAISVFIDDQVPFGKVKLVRERGQNFLGESFNRNYWKTLSPEEQKKYIDKLTLEQQEKNRKEEQGLFGNILLKLCFNENTHTYYFQAEKIDMNGSFLPPNSGSRERLEQLFRDPDKSENLDFRWQCKRDPYNNDICELFKPILSSVLASKEKRLAAAEDILQKLTPEVLNDIIDNVMTEIPANLRNKIKPILDLLKEKVKFFRDFVMMEKNKSPEPKPK